MEKQFEDIKFKYEFRNYQKETLQMLERYINDKKIHIVAPPGAGKTILGLELMLRIGKKTIILVPSIVIKEQWIERLKKDFINGDKKGLISGDILEPKYITIDTYQGLYALDSRNVDVNKIFKDNEIKTIVLDEAHHLRKKWQTTLMNIIDKNKQIHSISLTATPPYDNEIDYNRYIDLCGEIDVKITVAQMVKNKCLCPHQDYIYFNVTDDFDKKEILEDKMKINKFLEYIFENEKFIKVIALHDYIIDTDNNINKILENFEFFIAMISFLKEKNLLIGNKLNEINVPKFDLKMLELILEELIFNSKTIEIKIFKEEIENIKKELKILGCIDKYNRINLKYSQKISNLLTKNYEKLNSIVDIVNIESKSLGKELKLVIAADYIKDEYMYNEENEIKELGIIPIFKKILNSNKLDVKVVVLTGRVLIIPTDCKEDFLKIANKEYNISSENIKISEMGIDFKYSIVEIDAKYEKIKAILLTKFFEKCDIQVLIGTIALIGEGWDAPFVNTIIIATYTSSFVTSNQLRGRAIRIDKNKKDKFANIWHLICMEEVNEGLYSLGYDYDILEKRFLNYEGIDNKKNVVSSGIKRLNIEQKQYNKSNINELNNHMIESSKERRENIQKWEESLKNYNPMIKNNIDISKKTKGKINTICNSSFNNKTVSLIVLFIAIQVLHFFPKLENMGLSQKLKILAINILIIGIISILNIIKKTNWYYLKEVINACFKMLKKEKIISNKSKCISKITSAKIEYGLNNASTYEQMIFIKTVKDSLNISADSRYLITFNNHILKVPKIFAKNKKEANKFLKYIKSFNKKIIYTKTEKGKEKLFEYKLKILKYPL